MTFAACVTLREVASPARLNEIAQQSRVGIELEESALPIHEQVRGACELLGLDPLYVANEGKLIAIVAPQAADAVLQAMRRHPLGAEAQIVGIVRKEHPGLVTMRTPLGTTRVVDMLDRRSIASHLLGKLASAGRLYMRPRDSVFSSAVHQMPRLAGMLSAPVRNTQAIQLNQNFRDRLIQCGIHGLAQAAARLVTLCLNSHEQHDPGARLQRVRR